jgi:hypothetical protein
MEEHILKILKIEPVTHDVKRFTLERPEGYSFVAGQATEISINSPAFKDKKNPFTFTGLNESSHLEFTIKIYKEHNGVTKQLGTLKVGDELVLHDVWGAIHYEGEGVFIAGGAGITPFIAILRRLHNDGKIGDNTLIFSNKTEADIILHDELKKMLGENFINTLTDEKKFGFENRIVDKTFLQEKISDFSQHFYVCGPPPMVSAVNRTLTELGAHPDSVVFEK